MMRLTGQLPWMGSTKAEICDGLLKLAGELRRSMAIELNQTLAGL